eukprot:6619151-Karenia_brevis.AAC.1
MAKYVQRPAASGQQHDIISQSAGDSITCKHLRHPRSEIQCHEDHGKGTPLRDPTRVSVALA